MFISVNTYLPRVGIFADAHGRACVCASLNKRERERERACGIFGVCEIVNGLVRARLCQ
jgi:hypothetical protein